jgi:uncharacterized protein
MAPHRFKDEPMLELRWAGEDFAVLSQRALWWPRRATLCIADLHLGKAAAFRQAGVPVPEHGTAADLARLGALLNRFAARRLVILGDLLHARAGRADDTMSAFAAWRQTHNAVDVLLVRGNHDAHAGDPPSEWQFRIEDEPFADADDGEIAFAHFPEAAAERGRRVLCGHIHPAIHMAGPSRGLRAPCFWFGDRAGVLPAFGSFTGTKAVFPGARDRVFAVGPGEIAEVSRAPLAVG